MDSGMSSMSETPRRLPAPSAISSVSVRSLIWRGAATIAPPMRSPSAAANPRSRTSGVNRGTPDTGRRSRRCGRAGGSHVSALWLRSADRGSSRRAPRPVRTPDRRGDGDATARTACSARSAHPPRSRGCATTHRAKRGAPACGRPSPARPRARQAHPPALRGEGLAPPERGRDHLASGRRATPPEVTELPEDRVRGRCHY